MLKNIKAEAMLAFPYDVDFLNVGKQKLFTRIKEAYGYADDHAVDLEGSLCCAHLNRDAISKFLSQGHILLFFVLPVRACQAALLEALIMISYTSRQLVGA